MHPEGRLVAIQQQMHFAKWFADASGMEHQDVLDALRESGMRLVPDENEIAVDASNVLPAVNEMKEAKEEQFVAPKLTVVTDSEAVK
jgi:hypothetical protein